MVVLMFIPIPLEEADLNFQFVIASAAKQSIDMQHWIASLRSQ
jgi:hypothetical protein